MQYSGDVKQVLTNNLSEQEAETMKDLQNLAPTIERSNADLKEGVDNTKNSTVERTLEEIGNKSGEIVDPVLDKIFDSNKKY